MSTTQRGTKGDDSKVRSRIPAAPALRLTLALAGLVGALLLVLATFSDMSRITAVTAELDSSTGWDRHGPALLLLAALAVAMLAGALRGSRPAMASVAAAGVAALLIALVWDLPAMDDARGYDDLYEGVEAGPESGYYLETLGGVLLLVSGGGLLLLASRLGEGRGDGRAARRAPRRRSAGGAGREDVVAQGDPERERSGDDLPV